MSRLNNDLTTISIILAGVVITMKTDTRIPRLASAFLVAMIQRKMRQPKNVWANK